MEGLTAGNLAEAMSMLNSEPRPALGGALPIRLFRAALGEDAEALLAALGVREVPYGELLMSPEAIGRAREREEGRPRAKGRDTARVRARARRAGSGARRGGRAQRASGAIETPRPQSLHLGKREGKGAPAPAAPSRWLRKPRFGPSRLVDLANQAAYKNGATRPR